MKTRLKKEGVLVLKEFRCVNMPCNRIKLGHLGSESGAVVEPHRGVV